MATNKCRSGAQSANIREKFAEFFKLPAKASSSFSFFPAFYKWNAGSNLLVVMHHQVHRKLCQLLVADQLAANRIGAGHLLLLLLLFLLMITFNFLLLCSSTLGNSKMRENFEKLRKPRRPLRKTDRLAGPAKLTTDLDGSSAGKSLLHLTPLVSGNNHREE